jgi:hypothetical protein
MHRFFSTMLNEISRNYHVPISNTAAATMVLECATAEAPAAKLSLVEAA